MNPTEPIAIVGMACRYADAKSPEELWQNVMAQRRGFRRLPSQRLSLDDYGHPAPSSAGAETSGPVAQAHVDRTYVREAAVLEDFEVDRVRFRIAGATQEVTDLTHWLALDLADQAIRHAGFDNGEGLPKATTGVLVGNTLTGEMSRASSLRLRWPYVRRVVASTLQETGYDGEQLAQLLHRLEAVYKQPFAVPTDELLAGGLSNTIAGRICNHFDFHGGGYVVDGACASSLLALAQACSALVAGDLDAALVGGVDISLDPFELVGFARAGALAPDEMRVYDAGSAGFLPGEGGGFLVLMRSSDAKAQGLRVHALIRGWGISSDGHGGMTRPTVAGQRFAFDRAYRRAGYGIDSVGYFEGHGTGTAVGDATELLALDEAISAFSTGSAAGDDDQPAFPAAIGSVKANIGHTKAAAGVAGVIKAVLALEHRILPPTTGCERPHAELRRASSRLRALATAEPWPGDRPMRAGVSGLGFGGINAHVTLEAAESDLTEPGRSGRRLAPVERQLDASHQDLELLLFAAPDLEALAAKIERARRLAGNLSRAELTDFAIETVFESSALQASQGALARAAVLARRPKDLEKSLERLGDLIAAGERRHLDVGDGIFFESRPRPWRLGFIFPGQGSPVRDGGAWKRRFPQLDDAWPAPPAPAALPALPSPRSGAVDTERAQPAIVADCLAALQLLEQLGVRAEVAVGHSLGELVALHWAGALSAQQLVQLATARGRAMAVHGEAGGAMAAVRADAAAVEQVLVGHRLVVAAYNGPLDVVIAGPAPEVTAALEDFKRSGIHGVRLEVSHAFHSPAMAPARSPLDRALAEVDFAEVDFSALDRRVHSTITGAPLTGRPDLPELLRRQLTEPVRFAQALAASDVDLWLEVGPGDALTRLLGRTGGTGGTGSKPAIALDAGGPTLLGLLSALAAAWAGGRLEAPEQLIAGRFHRPFRTDKSFLANPCESVPVFASDVSALVNETLGAEAAPKPIQPSQLEVPPSDLSPLNVLRDVLAERLDLPLESIEAHHRLLADLHLSSLAVGQVMAEAVRRLGAPAPTEPWELADATLAEAAATLEVLGRLDSEQLGVEAGPPPPLEPWVRSYHLAWQERPLSSEPLAGIPAAALPAAGPGADATAHDPASAEGWCVLGEWPRTEYQSENLSEDLSQSFSAQLESRLAQRPGSGPGPGVVLLVPPTSSTASSAERVDLFVRVAAEVTARRATKLVVLQGGQSMLDGAPEGSAFGEESGYGAGGFARSLHLEQPTVTTWLLEPGSCDPQVVIERLLAEIERPVEGFRHVAYDPDGRRRQPVWRVAELAPPAQEAWPLAPGDVLLVTGGGKGIGAESAFRLATVMRLRLAILGRSSPASDAALASHLERLQDAGVETLYIQADVSERSAVEAAVATLGEHWGPVRGILHAAGVNRPARLGQLQPSDFLATLAPKVEGLRHLLDLLGPQLRLLVAFGSVIGRSGLIGEAHYATANEWLRQDVERWAHRHPGCQCLCLEWSVWASVGMGERLGRLDALRRQGIEPIGVEQGLALLETLVRQPAEEGPVSRVLASRLGDLPTFELARQPLPLLRFLERPRLFYPGVELIVDSQLSVDTDPYLDDHVFDGERLLPAVIGLEAMVQAACGALGLESVSDPFAESVRLRDVTFHRPVVVPQAGTRLRLLAVHRGGGVVDVALRAASSAEAGDSGRFDVDAFTARVEISRADSRAESRSGELERIAEPAWGSAEAGLRPPEIYRSLLFQSGRFRRLEGYRHISARELSATLGAAGRVPWLARHLPDQLLLGDPGCRDAALHALQASIPHATVLPVSVARVEIGRLGSGPTRVIARERSRHGRTLVYDLDVVDSDGHRLESWRGLVLRALPRHRVEPWPAVLTGPFLERRLHEVGVQSLRVLVGSAAERPGLERRQAGNALLARLTGLDGWSRRADGKPVHPAAAELAVSLAYGGGLALAVAADHDAEPQRVGVDLEAVLARPAEQWARLLGSARMSLVRRLVAESVGDLSANHAAVTAVDVPAVDVTAVDIAATRIWAALECAKKAGLETSSLTLAMAGPLAGEVAGEVPGTREKFSYDDSTGGLGDLVVLRAGSGLIYTFCLFVAEAKAPFVWAVLRAPAFERATLSELTGALIGTALTTSSTGQMGSS